MGLDQYLYANKHAFGNDYPEERWQKMNSDFIKFKEAIGEDVKYLDSTFGGSISVQMKIGYWRKANAIHQWFVDNCQNGEDDCREANVHREQLEELLGTVKEVLADHGKAEELLPTQEGFFYGSLDYDEYYYSCLEDTVKILENALSIPNEWDFSYKSSW